MQLRDAIAANAAPPDDYVDATIAERFGWPLSVLEGEDEGRVKRAVKLLNFARAYQRCLDATKAHRPEAIPASDWVVFQMLDALGETDD